MKTRIIAILLVISGLLIGFFVYSSEAEGNRFNFKYGLDLDGGTSLTYRADTSTVSELEVEGAMNTLRRTIERRVNVFGVSEPIVQVEEGGVFGSDENQNRLIVELPGVTDITEAIDAIGKTPLLEFKLAKVDEESAIKVQELLEGGEEITPEEILSQIESLYESTGLTGGQLKDASLIFDNVSGEPIVQINFNSEGTDLFRDITRENIGNILAIFLDGEIVSDPVIRSEIFGGVAQISGQFSAEEARDLVQNLNFGALPLSIELIETKTIGASLGQNTLNRGISALVWAFGIIFVFLIIWYRLPGIIATISLIMYVFIMLALFKLIPVTLTSSGLAGFILSLGMAVDANVLIFERVKEELLGGAELKTAVEEGFNRAWLPIRDGNLSSIISAVVLFWLSGTSLVKGFALVFGIGVLVSMLTAVVVSRTLLLAVANDRLVSLFGSGLKK
ncbi:MAG: preprotein translocase subunit SecD [Candidatus Paceibacteria bacterium]|jgi:preprotein translocase subunit SecD